MHILYTAIEGRAPGCRSSIRSRCSGATVGAPTGCTRLGPPRALVRRLLKISLRVSLARSRRLRLPLGRVRASVDGCAARRRPTVAAIIVLGAAEFDGRPSKILAARLDHAIDLYRRASRRSSW